MTQQIDPLGRETDYAYATNNIDLLTVKQKNGSGYLSSARRCRRWKPSRSSRPR